MQTITITITNQDGKDYDLAVKYRTSEAEPRTFEHPGCQRGIEIYSVKYQGVEIFWALSGRIETEIEDQLLKPCELS